MPKLPKLIVRVLARTSQRRRGGRPAHYPPALELRCSPPRAGRRWLNRARSPLRVTLSPTGRVATPWAFTSEGQQAIGEIAGDRAGGRGAGGWVECQGTG